MLMKESGEALQRQAEWWPQDVNPVIASMLLADGGGGFGFLTLPPESDPLKLKWTPEGEAVGAKVTAMFLEARRRGHTLVLLESLPNRLEMGFVQVPTQHSLITPGPGKGVLISFGKPELEKALTGLMALVLLESFRVLVESAIPSWGGHLPRIDWTVRLRTTLNLWPLTSAAIKLAESMD